MKRLLLVGLMAASVSGCALNMKLLDEGRTHEGHFSPASRSMDVTIDGKAYSGPMTQSTAIGFGTSFAGRRMVQTTTVGTGSDGQAVMTSPDGKWLQCQFSAALGQGVGQCQDASGKIYPLLIGTAATPVVEPDPKNCIPASDRKCLR